MPIPEGVETSYIIKNLENRVKEYNNKYSNYIRHYNNYINKRNLYLKNFKNVSKIIEKMDYIFDLRKILIEFGMNARNSSLMDNIIFQETLIKNVDLIIQIEDSKNTIKSIKSNSQIIKISKQIFYKLSRAQALTYSGGFVIASKTLHFLFPELFIMIDNTHIGISLYNVVDYLPHSSDGRNWYQIISDFSGKKPQVRSLDSERYCLALFYYKRLYYEWLEYYKASENDFMNIDRNTNYITRILDKGLW